MKAVAKLKDEARKYEQSEQWESAIQAYVEVLRLTDNAESELPLYNRIGDLYVRMGRPLDAVTFYEQAADHYAEAGLYNNGIALCNKALRYVPNRLELLRKLGQYSAAQGFLTDARRWYLEYAERQLKAGALDDAFTALEDFATLYEDADIRELLGRQLRAHNRVGPAVTALKRAMVLREEAGETAAAQALRAEILAMKPDAFADGGTTAAAPPTPAPSPPPSSRATDLPGFSDFDFEAGPAPAVARPPAAPMPPAAAPPPAPPPVTAPPAVPPMAATDAPTVAPPVSEPPVEIEVPDLPYESHADVEPEVAEPVARDPEPEGPMPVPEAEPESASVDFDERLAALALDRAFEPEPPPATPEPLPGLEDVFTPPAEASVQALDAPPQEADGPEMGAPGSADEFTLDGALLQSGSSFSLDLPPLDDTFTLDSIEPLPFLNLGETGSPDPGLLSLDDFDLAGSRPPAPRVTGLPEFETTQPLAPIDLDAAFASMAPPASPPPAPEPLLEPAPVPEPELPASPAAQEAVYTPDSTVESDWVAPAELPEPVSPAQEWTQVADPEAVDVFQYDAVEAEAEPVVEDLPMLPTDDSAVESDASVDEAYELPPLEESRPGPEDGFSPAEQAPQPDFESAPAEELEVTAEAVEVEAANDYGAVEELPVEEAEPVPTAEAEFYRLRAQVELGDTAEALDRLEALSDVLAADGHTDLAWQASELLVQLDPTSLKALHNQVEHAAALGQREVLLQSYLDLARALKKNGAATKSNVMYQRVLDIDPENEEAQAVVHAAAQPVTTGGYVDLFALIADEDDDEASTRFQVAEQAPSGDEERDFADMLAQFKHKVAENISVNETAAHYDLGIAFKEMGLIDEAIAEFQTAMKGGGERLKLYEELGYCFLLKQQYNVAVNLLNRALQLPIQDARELMGVYYTLGRSYQALGQVTQARAAYEHVIGLDINFQDASERLATL